MKQCQLINDNATRQLPATIGWAVYEQAGPGRVLGRAKTKMQPAGQCSGVISLVKSSHVAWPAAE